MTSVPPTQASGSDGRTRGPKSWLRAEPGFALIAGVLVLFQIVGLFLVITAELVPDAVVANRLVQGIETGLITEVEHPSTGLDNRVDRWTECIAFTVGLGDTAGANAFESAVRSPHVGRCQVAVPELIAYRDGGSLESRFDYYRYWHGYTILTRPALALFGVAGTRMLALAAVAAALSGLMYVIGRSASLVAAILLGVPLILTTDFVDLQESTPHAMSMAVTLGAGALVWVMVQQAPSRGRIFLAGALAGALSAFIDLMVLFPGAWTLTVMITMLASFRHGARGARLFWNGVLGATAWITGLVVTWVSKWVIAGFVVGFGETYDTITNQILFRVSGDFPSVDTSFGLATTRNVGYWLQRPLTMLILVPSVVLTGWLLYRGIRYGRLSAGSAVILLLPGLLPVIWYEALSSHSQIHFWLTYKSLGLVLGASLVVVFVCSGLLEATLRGEHVNSQTVED